jgi:hypothetical protein
MFPPSRLREGFVVFAPILLQYSTNMRRSSRWPSSKLYSLLTMEINQIIETNLIYMAQMNDFALKE